MSRPRKGKTNRSKNKAKRRSQPPRKRKVRITVEARDPKDARRILKAIENTLRSGAAEPPALEAPAEERIDDVQHVANEQMETEANRRVGAHLDAKDRAKQGEIDPKGLPTDAAPLNSAEEIVEKRSKLVNWMKTAGHFGYRITVKVMADLIKNYINSP